MSALIAAPVPTGARYLVIHLPAFRLERCGWGADELVVLVAEQQNATRVVACTSEARAQGLVVGHTVAEARARCPDVRVEVLDAEGEADDRADLVAAFVTVSDRVAAYDAEALVLEVSAVRAWAGGEEGVLARARARLDELGHVGCLVVADHPRAAWALARRGGADRIVPEGAGAEALAALPIAALGPSDEVAQALATLGIRTVAPFARLDPASVVGRFGDDGLELHRVARGAPGPVWAARAEVLAVEPVVVRSEHELVDRDDVVVLARTGFERLREALRAREAMAAVVEVVLHLAWSASERVVVQVAQPTRCPDVLGRLLRDRLERVHLASPVGGLTLRVVDAVSDGVGQLDLLDHRARASAWSELLARLGDVLGGEALVAAEPQERWAPEASWWPRAWGSPDEGPGVDEAPDDPVEPQEIHAWREARPRPSLLRDPPLPVHVDAPDGRPRALRTRRGWDAVRRVEGPERLSGAWWTPGGGFDRTYWVAELPEGTAWLFLERDRWYLHGWFD